MSSLVKRFVARIRLAGKALSPSPPMLAAGRRRVGWLGSLGLVLLGLLALNPFLGQRIAEESYDLAFRLRPRDRVPTPADLLVVRMDDESRRALGQRREFAWDRDLHARLIDNLADAGSGPVVIDLLFAEDAPGDTNLARAMARHGRVVVSANLTRRSIPGLGEVEDLEVPVAAVATNAAAVGLLNVVVGKDGVPRRMLPGRGGLGGSRWEPTLSWAAAKLSGRNLAEERGAPLANLWLNYYGPANSLPSIAYEDAIKPEAAPRLRDRMIVVGAHFQVDYPGTRKDTFPTPYGAGRQEIPGLELHATAWLNLTRGEWLQRLDAPFEAALVVAFGLVLGFGLPRLRPVAALFVCLGIVAAVGCVSLLAAWDHHTWWSWLVPVAVQTPVGFLWALGAHLILLGHEKEIFRRSLATYLPPGVVEEIAARPESLRLGGNVRRVVILLTDITDF
ncbi:MAG: CHASE2 domain-containing protein, partial [Verrucomicrobiales bacterium]|nr:CHASE2 domain-containing protein [Verrucomicrobiales bacterium]